ncbi:MULTISPECIES: hypothetical protein [unclassified Corallococcus]|uniref:hypothetical protein n=1 Tax=unclassified Corallococcus TaxID=2685029 RepID=UPI001A8FBCB5|nr:MULTISPECIES: hypothetical protein [unclassified Corallococcus]MBN9682509.1 hypothetical protein [Corallococcus sp. NCSPR001]WAS85939.1 hypothetical protein O0N60_02970 [Corallococcus sp. NCRR]
MRMFMGLLVAGALGWGCQAAGDKVPAKAPLDCSATYVACGCGCCGGVEPEVQCLSCSKGDDLQALIQKDEEAKKDPQCAVMGCSPGTKYVYCDANPQ